MLLIATRQLLEECFVVAPSLGAAVSGNNSATVDGPFAAGNNVSGARQDRAGRRPQVRGAGRTTLRAPGRLR
jgi:hypothetical protein